MKLPEIEAIVGRLYLALSESQKENLQLKEILAQIGVEEVKQETED